MITRIEAYNYRCFQRLNIELGGFRVIAGANGAGKSTLLDIPSLLGDLVRTGDVGEAFFEPQQNARAPRAQRAEDIVTFGKPPRTVASVAVELALPASVRERIEKLLSSSSRNVQPWRVPNTVRYELSLEPINGRLEATEEFVICFVDPDLWTGWEAEKAGSRPKRPTAGDGLIGRADSFQAPSYQLLERQPHSLRYGPEGLYDNAITPSTTLSETRIRAFDKKSDFELNLASGRLALSEVPADERRYPVLCWLQSFFRDGILAYDPSPDALRFATPPVKTRRLRANAANLPWLLHSLASFEPPYAFEDWTLQLRHTIPGVRSVEPYVREEDGHASFKVIYEDQRKINASGLSDGTLRLIALTAVAYVTGVPPLLIIEQPEDGVHPKGISDLVEAFQVHTRNMDGARDQVWVSTHSPILLAEVPLRNIVILTADKYEGSRAIRGDEHPRLADWQGSVNPGKLFASGVLG